ESLDRPMRETLVDSLRHMSQLVLLDNCEHLLPACAQLADTLLRSCPNLRILATSREGLDVAGELTYLVPSLSLPDCLGNTGRIAETIALRRRRRHVRPRWQ